MIRTSRPKVEILQASYFIGVLGVPVFQWRVSAVFAGTPEFAGGVPRCSHDASHMDRKGVQIHPQFIDIPISPKTTLHGCIALWITSCAFDFEEQRSQSAKPAQYRSILGQGKITARTMKPPRRNFGNAFGKFFQKRVNHALAHEKRHAIAMAFT